MTTLSTQPERPERARHPYISRKPGVGGGKPIIEGTRIKVSLVAREYLEIGMTPPQIQEAHPNLTLAQIHDALSYYYDHEAEIQAELREADAFVEKFQGQAEESPFSKRMRAAGKLP
jgi:uncharacterized protein (DUF433 family)